jgi:hypothetical protein
MAIKCFWRLDILQDPHAFPTGCVLLEPCPRPTDVPALISDAWDAGTKAWYRCPDGGWIVPAEDYSDAMWLAADCVSTFLHNERHRKRWQETPEYRHPTNPPK